VEEASAAGYNSNFDSGSDMCSSDDDSEYSMDSNMETDDSELVHPSHIRDAILAFQTAYPEMDSSTARLLANIDSIAAMQGFPDMATWMASKSAAAEPENA
jgi:short-subunit dehydrogenase